jgi:hypothetical protein
MGMQMVTVRKSANSTTAKFTTTGISIVFYHISALITEVKKETTTLCPKSEKRNEDSL